jgi:hypothetical protein
MTRAVADRVRRRLGAALAGAALLGYAWQQADAFDGDRQQVVLRAVSIEPQQVSQAEYAANLTAMESLATSCGQRADACDATKAADDFDVVPAEGHRFTVRRNWLRIALNDAKTAKDGDRAELMKKVKERLQADAAELTASPEPTPPVAEARKKANAILARNEFSQVKSQNWLTQRYALLAMAIQTYMNRVFSSLPQAPGLVPLLEWGLLGTVAVGLMVWAWRMTMQQRLTLDAPRAEWQMVWQRESDDWARKAEEQAAAGAWREAVHCVYWAAIVMLEGKRLWRTNRARTPREYLPLLEAGSPRQSALAGLTRIFERIWYGLRAASEEDYERARALLLELKAG